jgi:hypothetical protein
MMKISRMRTMAKPKAFTPSRSDAEDMALVLAAAKAFSVIAFRGRGIYERRECPSLALARLEARKLYQGRPIGIYAVAEGLEGATARSRHIENWVPIIRQSRKQKVP